MDGIQFATDERKAIDSYGEKLSVFLFLVVYVFVLQTLRSQEMQHCYPLMLAQSLETWSHSLHENASISEMVVVKDC